MVDGYRACPVQVVNAPASAVWQVLLSPKGWGKFVDARITKVIPPGKARVGQRIYATTGFGFLQFPVNFRILGIDKKKGHFRLHVDLPLGMTNEEDMSIIPLGPSKCLVKYDCNISFKDSLVGRMAFLLNRGEFDRGPAESIARLKSAAERLNGKK